MPAPSEAAILGGTPNIAPTDADVFDPDTYLVRRALDETARTVHLVPGDLAVVDNRAAVHGRTAFRPRYDGNDRWLQRTYCVRDLRRSRHSRLADGHVLVR